MDCQTVTFPHATGGQGEQIGSETGKTTLLFLSYRFEISQSKAIIKEEFLNFARKTIQKDMCVTKHHQGAPMNKEKQDRAMFLSFCIEQYANAKKMPTENVVNLFEQYGIAEHFCEFYEVLHTQGHNWLIEEIDQMINNRKQ